MSDISQNTINEECVLSGHHIRSYVICTTPRSGSTMLCKLLAATRVAGNPGSHFHEPSISAWLGYYDLEDQSFSSDQDTLAAVFAAAFEVGKGQTDVFGLRPTLAMSDALRGSTGSSVSISPLQRILTEMRRCQIFEFFNNISPKRHLNLEMSFV